MQWFYIQRLYNALSGGATTNYIGPFYGDPSQMSGLIGSSDRVMVYANGTWNRLA